MTRDEAVALIERMKTIRPTCDKCETRPFVASLKEPDGPPGFEPMAHFAGYVKRCEACAIGKTFPWADKLTPEAVVAFVECEPWRDDQAWLLADLKPVADEMLHYRTFMITGVCKLDHEHGKGDCVYDRGEPERKGFEFL